VLENRHPAEELRSLKGARDPLSRDPVRAEAKEFSPLEAYLPLLRPVETAHDIEQSALTGSVRPDEPADFSGLDIHRDILQGHDAPERDGDLAQAKDGHRESGRRGSGAAFRARPPHAGD